MFRFKNQLVQYFFIFGLIVFSSKASIISSSEIYLVIFFLITLIYSAYINELHLSTKKVFTLFFLSLILIFYYYWINSGLNIITWAGWILKIFLTILIVNINKFVFVRNFIKFVYLLTIISLFGYCFQLLEPKILFSINNWFGLIDRGNSNSLFFNFTYLHQNRNSGCMWEPGAFAAVLIIALLLIEFYQTEKYTKEKIIISIGLLTTISTTGYLLFGLILLFSFLYKSKGKMKIFGLILFFPIGIYFFINSQILSSKINSQLIGIEEEVDKAYNNPDYTVGVTRFTSIIIDLPTFLKRPILGYGIDIYTTSQKSIYKTYGDKVIRSSGLMILLLEFGIIGTLIYFTLLYKNIFKLTNSPLITSFTTLSILFIIFSNPLEFSPIILSLFYIKKSNRIKDKKLSFFNKKNRIIT